jgi:hypothetical protein
MCRHVGANERGKGRRKERELKGRRKEGEREGGERHTNNRTTDRCVIQIKCSSSAFVFERGVVEVSEACRHRYM